MYSGISTFDFESNRLGSIPDAPASFVVTVRETQSKGIPCQVRYLGGSSPRYGFSFMEGDALGDSATVLKAVRGRETQEFDSALLPPVFVERKPLQ